ncbi:MAG TPA: hypothetical protein VMR25_26605 [Planctomycetaceae bacterium]|jgi:hypothetical protein|nr:hypothetical protein [Planctomycetaceae bacterium]
MVQILPTIEPAWTGHRLRVPRQDFAVVADPPLPAALETAELNHRALTTLETKLQGRTVGQLREWTRKETLRAARDYTSELLAESTSVEKSLQADGSGSTGSELLFVAGHQPSLFHPGVWVKNFAVHELASRSGGISLNLSVDTDVMGSTRIRVPTGGRSAPRVERVPFDADRPRSPWEENEILDRELFESFGRRVCDLLAEWHVTPLLRDFWPEAVRASQRFSRICDCLIAARSQIERQWGAGNLELPISRICELDPFLWFVGHILAHLPRFCEVHNQVLAEYRVVNHVRSRTHPVPELKAKDGWVEAPFWIWRRGDTVRSRLFARQVGREVLLSDGREEFARLPLSPQMDACCAVEVLRELPRQGIRIRARALTTTLFARLCLADLFVHGIGGAKYDEMTDRILARFFGVPAPGFLTMTATLHATLADPFPVVPEDETRIQRLLRDLRWNPDRHVATDRPEVARWIAEKKTLLASLQSAEGPCGTRRARHARSLSNFERFRRIHEVNRRLTMFVTDQEQSASNELAEIRQQLAANAVLQDREYASCLYPADKLRRLMASLWPSRS